MLVKRCPRCKSTKPLEDFPGLRSSQDGRYPYCRPCVREQNAKTRRKRIEKAEPVVVESWLCKSCDETKPATEFHLARSTSTGLRPYCKACVSRRHRREKYALHGEAYEAMVKAQDGRCLICKQPGRALQVDHCHTWGHTRGLLCGPCNRGLGDFRDDPVAMRAAADYVEATRPTGY